MKVVAADFVTTAVEPAGYPSAGLPEIAFAGRSNVGKSSMINALCQRHKLVRVSNTPGRTRTLNFFEVVVELPPSGGARVPVRHTLRFCDLPGYGFAKVSKAEQKGWQQMIEQYLLGREGLRAVVCIVDANVGPTDDDLAVIPWVKAAGRSVIVAATKVDRVPKHRRIPRTREIAHELREPEGQVVGVSAKEHLNLDALWELILRAS